MSISNVVSDVLCPRRLSIYFLSNNNKSIIGSLTSSGLHQMQKILFQMHVAILLLHMIILWSTHHLLPLI